MGNLNGGITAEITHTVVTARHREKKSFSYSLVFIPPYSVFPLSRPFQHMIHVVNITLLLIPHHNSSSVLRWLNLRLTFTSHLVLSLESSESIVINTAGPHFGVLKGVQSTCSFASYINDSATTATTIVFSSECSRLLFFEVPSSVLWFLQILTTAPHVGIICLDFTHRKLRLTGVRQTNEGAQIRIQGDLAPKHVIFTSVSH